MATARQQPSSLPAAKEHADRAARWPILARIAEIRRDDEAPAREPVSRAPTYRLDAPHVEVPAPPTPTPTPVAKPQALPPQRSGEPQSVSTIAAPASTPNAKRDSYAPTAPVRPGTDASQGAQPRQELIRFAAMLAMMVVAGMSAVLIMRDRFHSASDASSPVAATTSQPNNVEPAAQHAELEPTLEPQLAPETDTSSLEPTATGPLAPPSHPIMAIESNAAPAALPYPSTSFAEITLPPVDGSKLPQVQTTEVEVARLQETTNETKTH